MQEVTSSQDFANPKFNQLVDVKVCEVAHAMTGGVSIPGTEWSQEVGRKMSFGAA